MKRTDYSNNGGLKFAQNRIAFLQSGYNEAFSALARLCGDKVILYGVEKVGGFVSDGWIAYGGELIRFIGGAYAVQVVITEQVVTNLVFADNSAHDVHFDKTATCGAVGDFLFTDLVPLLSLQNTWKKDDIRICHKDNAYAVANFDADGYGINAEVGWRLIEKAYPNAAGRVMVNRDPADADFDETAKLKGAKTHTLTANEQGKVKWRIKSDDGDDTQATLKSVIAMQIEDQVSDVNALPSSTWGPFKYSALNLESIVPHPIIQPSYVVLTLIKL